MLRSVGKMHRLQGFRHVPPARSFSATELRGLDSSWSFCADAFPPCAHWVHAPIATIAPITRVIQFRMHRGILAGVTLLLLAVQSFFAAQICTTLSATATESWIHPG